MDLLSASFPASSCSTLDVNCVAKGVVDNVLYVASKLIDSDPERVFLYKRPKIDFPNTEAYVSDSTFTNSSGRNSSSKSTSSDNTLPEEHLQWVTIEDFSLPEVLNQLRDFVGQWRLTPATKVVLVPQDTVEELPRKGSRYFVDACFSKPTPMCPNPLAVAKVHFVVHVSKIMPKDFPVMVTYSFEGYKTMFYALGSRALQSLTFQRLFIDTILQMKLAFYAEICEYQYPANNDAPASSEESVKEDE